MIGSILVKDWKDVGTTLHDVFSELSTLGDTSFTKHRDKSSVVCGDSFRKLKEEVKEVKTTFLAACEIVEKLRSENECLEKRLNENIDHENKKARYKKELECEQHILSKSKIKSEDELLKENTKLRYKSIRNMVQVKFMFDQKENNILNGFAFNKSCSKVKWFSINLSTMSQEEIKNEILEHMEQASGNTYGDIGFE